MYFLFARSHHSELDNPRLIVLSPLVSHTFGSALLLYTIYKISKVSTSTHAEHKMMHEKFIIKASLLQNEAPSNMYYFLIIHTTYTLLYKISKNEMKPYFLK